MPQTIKGSSFQNKCLNRSKSLDFRKSASKASKFWGIGGGEGGGVTLFFEEKKKRNIFKQLAAVYC